MAFEWDERKRKRNLEKHGFDFRRAHELLAGPHLIIPSSYGGEEKRFLAIGTIQGRFAAMIYTMRGETRRIISIRSARHAERHTLRTLYGSGNEEHDR